MQTTSERLLTKTELASYLNVSERSIEIRMKEGMPCVPVGRSRRFNLEKVLNWLCGRNE